jgi:hypothetical protein
MQNGLYICPPKEVLEIGNFSFFNFSYHQQHLRFTIEIKKDANQTEASNLIDKLIIIRGQI